MEVASGTPHHGAVLAMANSFFLTVKDPAKATSLPDSVRRFNASGQPQQTFGPCRDIHGDAASANSAVFGCIDGAMLIRHNGGQFTSQFISTTAAFDGFGPRAVLGRLGLPYYVLRFGNAQVRLLGKLDPATGTITRIQLPGGYPLAWEVDPSGQRMVVFEETGSLHVINMQTMAVEGTMTGVTAAVPSNERSRTPHLVVADDLTYLTSPRTGEVVVIDHRARTVRSRINVGGTPGRIVLLGPAADIMLREH